ncbi:hydrolase [Opitutus sp. ER46]|uniref:hydrolase n=1 Tax=Opitutus sp. ER46 TaxID=2161864 RepID=UPI001304F091|nr:hydrolase [Opitutus sp. ER46]
MSVPSSILALPQRTPELGALLERWANINSGSDHAAGLARMRETLRTEFARCFPAATIEEVAADAPGFNPPGVRSLSIRMRPAAPKHVLLCGHYDTVYEATSPFQTCRWVDAKTMSGPGTGDMKGGIVTLLAALQAFEQTANAAQLGWEVLLTPDEEIGSHGSLELFRAAARRNQFAFVFEPARPSGDIVHSRKGTGVFTAICHGRASHAAKVPNDGRNAVLALAEFLLGVAKLPDELPGVLVSVANINGGSPVTNVVPHYARADIDVRVTRMSDRDALLTRIHALAAAINAREGFRLELQGGFNRPPKECTPAEEAAYAAWQKAAADVGVPPFKWVHTGGASDGNFLGEVGLPTLDGLGPIADGLHSEREVCRVDTIAPRAQIAALFLHRVASGEVALPPVPAARS